MQPTKNGYVGASAEYAFDGNVLKAPKGLRKFTHREALIFKLTLDTKALKDPQACAVMSLKGQYICLNEQNALSRHQNTLLRYII